MNSSYKLICHKAAVNYLAKQEQAIQERIAESLKGLLSDPPSGDIKTIKGQPGLYRLRVGSYRILFKINHQEIYLLVRLNKSGNNQEANNPNHGLFCDRADFYNMAGITWKHP